MPQSHNSLFYSFFMTLKNHFLLQLFRRYYSRLILVFVFNFFSVLLTLLVFLMIEPFCKLLFRGCLDDLSPISSFFLNTFLPNLNATNLGSCVSLLVFCAILVYFLKTSFAYLAQWVMASVRSNLLFDYRNRLYHKLLRLPLGFFSNQKNGDMISRAISDTQEIEHTSLSALKSFMTDPVSIIFFIIFLLMISPRLTLYAVLLLPLSFVLIGYLTAALKRDARTAKNRLGSLVAHVEETLSGLRVVKAFNAQSNAERLFFALNDQFTNTQIKIYRRTDLASPLSEFLGVAVVMAVLIIGGFMVLSQNQALTAELFITYIALFTQIITPIKDLSTAFSNYKRGQASLERINDILDADETIKSPSNPAPLSGFNDAISFEHLSFAYDKVEVLHDIDFTIAKGQVVALVGSSGSGKSTLADLLERFYDPNSGSVKLDGIDIRNYDLEAYRSLFSLVSQDVVLFNDTLYNNITMGLPASEDEVMKAVEVANIKDFVFSLPDGLHYQLSDRGLNLSGGQRQRISIARAVLRNTPIIILDEATSAMDTESEHLVQQALDNVVKDRTVLVIAHRLSTIQKADKIIVLDAGRVVEQGTHAELVNMGGIYNNLIKIQNFN